MDDLVAVVSRERHALELLLFRLIETRAALADSQGRFLAWAVADLQAAATAVEQAGSHRGAVCAGGVSLGTLAEEASEPFATLLDEHRRELSRLAAEVEKSVGATRLLATAGLLEGSNATAADRDDARPSPDDGTARLARAIADAGYDAVLTATGSVRLAGLVAFLA